MADNVKQMNERAERIAERQHHGEIASADREFQERAAQACATLGLAAPARRTVGESHGEHRAKILDEVLGRVANLPHMDRAMLGIDTRRIAADPRAVDQVARAIFTSAEGAWRAPVGELRESVTKDSAGREVHTFYGDPENCWGRFKQRPRVVAKWNNSLGRGKDAVGAVPGHLMPNGTFVRQGG